MLLLPIFPRAEQVEAQAYLNVDSATKKQNGRVMISAGKVHQAWRRYWLGQKPMKSISFVQCCYKTSSCEDAETLRKRQKTRKSRVQEVSRDRSRIICPLWLLRRNTIKQVFWEFSYPLERSHRTLITSWALNFRVFCRSWKPWLSQTC